MYFDNRKRSILKTISWRVLATCATALIVYVFTGKAVLAVSVGGVEAVVKLILYFFHERLWNKINYGKKVKKPFVLWLTGLSGSGKSTLAAEVYSYLSKNGYKVETLDGDKVREIFPKTGFSKEERDHHIKRAGFLASMLEKNGIIVISSFISPYRETRKFVRNLCKNFIEIYVNAPLEVCEARDVKGLYKKARAGKIKSFTGIDDPYEEPLSPEVTVNTESSTLEECFNTIKSYINRYI